MRFYTHIDYDRHMAFVCEAGDRIVGDARYVANPGTRSCELGIAVADDWHHTGVAQLLMQALVRKAQARGFETMQGLVLADNATCWISCASWDSRRRLPTRIRRSAHRQEAVTASSHSR